ncbi:MAG: hypothetical protein WAU47_08260 [Desulfobaccales bacterium]
MQPQPVDSYIRAQGITCAVINLAANPALAWLLNRHMNFVPLWGGNSIVVDTAVTCLVLSLLVALFTASGVRQALHNGRLETANGYPRAARLLAHLPKQAWSLGLLLGLGAACVLTPLTFGLFHALGLSGLPLGWFALFKAMYTAPLGFVLTRWVILRQLLDHPE